MIVFIWKSSGDRAAHAHAFENTKDAKDYLHRTAPNGWPDQIDVVDETETWNAPDYFAHLNE